MTCSQRCVNADNWLTVRNLLLFGLEPDGCLVADLKTRSASKTFEKPDAGNGKNRFMLGWSTCKKIYEVFAMERCFLLTGAF